MEQNKKHTILIIDNVDEDRKFLRTHFQKSKYSVLEAITPEQAKNILDEKYIDFIIMDIHSGETEYIEKILSDKIPTIISTNKDAVNKTIEAINLGACSFVMKPLINPEKLNPAIEKCLRIKRQRKQEKLYTKHLEEELKLKNDEIERKNYLLKNFNKNLQGLLKKSFSDNSVKKLSNIGSDILNDFGAHLQASGGSIYIADEKGLNLVHSIETKHSPDFIPFPLKAKSPFKKVLETGKPILVDNIDSEKDLATCGWNGYTDSSFMIFPLPDHLGRVTGLLSLHNKTVPPFLSEDKEMGLLMSVFYKEVSRTISSIESLHVSTSKYEHLTENSAAIIFSYSIKSETFEFINSAFDKYTGLDREQILNKNLMHFFDYLDIQEKEDVISHFENMITGRGSGSALEYRIRTSSGDLKWVFQQTKTILNAEGIPISIDGIITEYSEQKEAEEKLKTLVKQKDLLLNEINHRVKNNLQIISSLINLQADLEPEHSIRDALRTAKNRITSLSLVHDNIYDTELMPTINIENYIEKLVTNLLETGLKNDKIETTMEFDEIHMDLDRAILCGLVINETVSNAFMHAFDEQQAGKVLISFKTGKEKYIIDITDNGRGFSPGQTVSNSKKGLGLDIMHSLIKQLEGTIDFISNNGTTIVIKFPLENTRIRKELK